MLLPLCRAAGVPFCVNDRLDVALAVGADVVHLGQDDLPLADAQRVRAAAGRPDMLIGFSTHNPAQAAAAAAAGADYIGFGPVFGTRSKANPDPTVGLDALAEVCRAVACPGGRDRRHHAGGRAGGGARRRLRGRADRRDRRRARSARRRARGGGRVRRPLAPQRRAPASQGTI